MPNSRLVRLILAPDHDRFQKETTMLLMQFGQFVDHDITHVPVFQFGMFLLLDDCVKSRILINCYSEWKWNFMLHSRG